MLWKLQFLKLVRNVMDKDIKNICIEDSYTTIQKFGGSTRL